jgi:hypothetical protein
MAAVRSRFEGEHELDGVAARIHSPVEVCPIPRNLEVRFIHPPETVGTAEFAAKPLIQRGRIMLDLAEDGAVMHRQAALRP